MTELKPCPFCGGRAQLCHEQRSSYIHCDGSIVRCGVCGAQAEWKMMTYSISADEEAAKSWNRRYKEEDE